MKLRDRWRTVREAIDLVRRELPSELLLGLEARAEVARLRATGFGSIEDLATAWHEAEQRTGRLLVDVVRAREGLFRALGGDEDDQDVPSLEALLEVAEARLEKLRRLEEQIADVDVAHLRAELDAAVGELRRLRSRSSSIRPRWDYVARAVPTIEEIVKSEPLYVARVDRLQARIRDTYDALGLEVTSEEVLYVTLVAWGMIVEVAADGIRSEMVSPVTLRNMAAVTQTLTAALIPYLPPEARGS